MLSTLTTFPWPPANLRELDPRAGRDLRLRRQYGEHARDLARARDRRGDLREAWERGIVLWGQSAGMICWFEAGVTDSFGPQLEGMECLGFLPGSACPHFDGEERRRPRYTRARRRTGCPPGSPPTTVSRSTTSGPSCSEIVTCRPGTAAYRVTRDGEERLEPRESGLAASCSDPRTRGAAARVRGRARCAPLRASPRRAASVRDGRRARLRATVCGRRGRRAPRAARAR